MFKKWSTSKAKEDVNKCVEIYREIAEIV